MAFDRVLRNNFWLVVAPLVAGAAFLNAQAVTALVGAGMEVDAAALAQAPPVARPAAHAASAGVVSAAAILTRNPFDHVTGSLVASPASAEGEESAQEIDMSDPLSAPECDGVHVNTVVASADANWSLASIAGSDKKAHLLRRGGDLSGQKVEFIGWDRVWLSSHAGLCQAKVFGAKTAPPTPVATPIAASSRVALRGAKALDPELRKGIVAISATEFNIDRSVVDRILENQSELMRQARIIPVQENGRTVGVRLLGIRPDTLLGVLGMHDNDRLQTINGFEVANPEKALEAYARLRTADKLTIQVNRGGKNMNLDYNIR